MPTQTDFFLNTPSSYVLLHTLQISHPSFSQVYRITKDNISGFTADDENSVSRTYAYYPFNLEISSSSDDLDYILNITFGDLGQVIPDEMDRVFQNGTISVKPTVYYRLYQYDNSSYDLLTSAPSELEIQSINFNSQGCSFEVTPVLTNATSIGRIYTVEQFAGLRGFV